jgi:hypothetical protein
VGSGSFLPRASAFYDGLESGGSDGFLPRASAFYDGLESGGNTKPKESALNTNLAPWVAHPLAHASPSLDT